MTVIPLSSSGARGPVICLHGGVGGGQRAAAQVCAQLQVYTQLLMRPAEAPQLGLHWFDHLQGPVSPLCSSLSP